MTQRSFDPLNRLVKITDPAKGVTTTVYDAFNRPTSVTDPNGGVTTYVYDGFGDLIQRVSPDSGATVYRYDPDGNLTQSVDGAGAVANHTYDALDRVLTTTYPADPAENVAYTYDQPAAGFGDRPADRPSPMRPAPSAAPTTSAATCSPRLASNGSATLTTAYTYDAASRVSSITYPSGWTVAYTRDIMGRTTADRRPASRRQLPRFQSFPTSPISPSVRSTR